MMDPAAALNLRGPPSLPLGPGFGLEGLLQGDDTAAASPMRHWANQQPLMAELGHMQAASAALQVEAACKNAALTQMVHQLWAQLSLLQNKVSELEEWKRAALDDMSKLRFEHKLLRKRLGPETAEPPKHPATVHKAKSLLPHGSSYTDLAADAAATPAHSHATGSASASTTPASETPAMTPAAKGKQNKEKAVLPSAACAPPPGLAAGTAKSVRFSAVGSASPPAAAAAAAATTAAAVVAADTPTPPPTTAAAPAVATASTTTTSSSTYTTTAAAAATTSATTAATAASSASLDVSSVATSDLGASRSSSTVTGAEEPAKLPATSSTSSGHGGFGRSPATSFSSSSPDQAESGICRSLSTHSVASSPDTVFGDDGPSEGVHVASAIMDGSDAEIAFWRITHLSQKLKGRIGRPLVSSPFAMLGLEDLRLMVFSDGKDPTKGPRSRRQKELYAKMVTEGPLEGCLKLKVPECPAPRIIEYYLKVGSCRKGPFRHDFSESTVHGCSDFGLDWLTEVDLDHSLTVTLEVIKR